MPNNALGYYLSGFLCIHKKVQIRSVNNFAVLGIKPTAFQRLRNCSTTKQPSQWHPFFLLWKARFNNYSCAQLNIYICFKKQKLRW
jgi:hypothetical protein